MFRDARSTTYFLMYILVALSGLGALVASQEYFFLQAQKEVALNRRALDESFLTVMKAVGGESNLEIEKELAQRKRIIEDVDSSDAAMIRQLEVRAIVDTTAWCVVLVISGLALILNGRKVTKPDVPPAV
jgi:hypothetical protein